MKTHPDTPQQGSPSSRPDAGFADLAARILAAEHAVVVRDHRVGHDAHALMDRLRAGSRYSARIAAAAGFGAFLLGWLMARRAPRSRHRAEQARAAGLAAAPWAGLVPLLWPLLPRAIRSRVSPRLASFVTGIGLPLVAQRLSKRAGQARPPAAANGAVTHH